MRTQTLSRKCAPIILALMGLWTDLLASESRGEPRAAEQLLNLKRPLVIAHRGYSAMAPENSLAAFRLAAIAGADLTELDYHHTKDGKLIVIHDYTADRTTDATSRWNSAKIRVDSKTAEELRTLDAGRWFHADFAGQKLLLLSEALDQIQKNNVTLIERKAGDAAACVRLLHEKDLVNQVVVQSFDWSYLRDFHKLEPKQILGALGPAASYDGKKLTDEEKILSPRWNDEVKRIGAKLVVWNRNVTKEAVDDAHKKGLEVWVYTINDVATAQKLLDMGIDGIITDNPSLIWRSMALK